MKHSILILFCFCFLLSCKEDKSDNPQRGDITIVADESFHNVTEALTYRYMQAYPDAKINVVYKKENAALSDLLNNKARVVIMSRELTDQERKLYDSQVALPWQPAYFAADALIFVVPKNSPITHLTYDQIRDALLSGERQLIFDGADGSNTNYIAQVYGLSPREIKYSALDSNEQIIEDLQKYPSHIGVVSYNTISRPHGKEAKMLRDQVKILPIEKDGQTIYPSQVTMRDQRYPFTRMLYFLTNEGYFGLGNGFIRYSCTQIGQIIVEKQGLQPYYLYKREVRLQ